MGRPALLQGTWVPICPCPLPPVLLPSPALPSIPPGSSSPQPLPQATAPEGVQGSSGVWKPHQSGAWGGCLCSALGSQLSLPSRCQGCRAGLDSAAAWLWANAELLCAMEKGREYRRREKGPYKHRQ